VGEELVALSVEEVAEVVQLKMSRVLESLTSAKEAEGVEVHQSQAVDDVMSRHFHWHQEHHQRPGQRSPCQPGQ